MVHKIYRDVDVSRCKMFREEIRVYSFLKTFLVSEIQGQRGFQYLDILDIYINVTD